MKTNGFTKMNAKQMDNSYGGWAWLATAVPLMLQTVMTAISSYKMLYSDKGSVKYDGADAHWENKQEKHSTKSDTAKHYFYAV